MRETKEKHMGCRKELKLVKNVNRNKGWKENDEDIRIQKKNVWKALKKWLKFRRKEDKIELKEEKKTEDDNRRQEKRKEVRKK